MNFLVVSVTKHKKHGLRNKYVFAWIFVIVGNANSFLQCPHHTTMINVHEMMHTQSLAAKDPREVEVEMDAPLAKYLASSKKQKNDNVNYKKKE